MRPEHRTFNAGNWTLDRFAQNLLIAIVSKLVMKYVAIKQRVVANMQVKFFAVTSTEKWPSMMHTKAPCWSRSSFLFSKFRRFPRACASSCFTHIGQYKWSLPRELQAVFAMRLPYTRAASLFQTTKPRGWFLTAQPRPDTTWWACL